MTFTTIHKSQGSKNDEEEETRINDEIIIRFKKWKQFCASYAILHRTACLSCEMEHF